MEEPKRKGGRQKLWDCDSTIVNVRIPTQMNDEFNAAVKKTGYKKSSLMRAWIIDFIDTAGSGSQPSQSDIHNDVA